MKEQKLKKSQALTQDINIKNIAMQMIPKYLSNCLIFLLVLSSVFVMAHEGHKKVKKDSVAVQRTDTVAQAPAAHTSVFTDTPPLKDFPNLHPLIVHFPIVLLIIAAAMQLVGLFLINRPYQVSIAIIAALGFIGAYLASSTFHAHPGDLTGPVADLFEEHEQWAFWSVRLGGIGAAIKIISLFIKPKKWIEAVVAIVLISSAVCVSISGHHGAELVHKYGIGAKGYMLEKHQH